MELKTFQFVNGKWSVDQLPDLDSKKTLILVFAAPEYIHNQAPIQNLVKYYPNSIMIGCSTSGEIFGARIYDLSLSIAVMKFENTEIKAVSTELTSVYDSYAAGYEIGEKLSDPDLNGVFVVSEGLQVNGSDLVKGLNSLVGEQVKITGGLAGDGKRFENTWTFFNGEFLNHTVVAVGFYGKNIKIGHGSKGGWDIFGPKRLVTKSFGNVLYELDGRPALELYKAYLGQRAAELPSSGLLFPLQIHCDENRTPPVVRTILSVDEDSQSLTFAGDIPEGSYGQLMRANFDRLITSAGMTGELATNLMFNNKSEHPSGNNPMLCIAISCVGRRLVLGERTEEELDCLADALPENCLEVGFYSYGELSP